MFKQNLQKYLTIQEDTDTQIFFHNFFGFMTIKLKKSKIKLIWYGCIICITQNFTMPEMQTLKTLTQLSLV